MEHLPSALLTSQKTAEGLAVGLPIPGLRMGMGPQISAFHYLASYHI